MYGDQTTAIHKIKKSEDRQCLVLVENGSPVAILVYKAKPTSEFSRYNIENSLEVKTFMLINPDSADSERHFMKLYSKVVEIAKQIHASGIHVTVSEKVTWTMSFLKKMGFKICRYWKDKYVQGLTECMLCMQFEEKLPDRESDTKRQRECDAERGSDFRKPEQDCGSKQRPEDQDQRSGGERSSGRDGESRLKRKYEGEHEFELKRQRMDGSNFDRRQSSLHSHQGSDQKREERGETSSGRTFFNSDRELNFTPGYTMRRGERGESYSGRYSSEKKPKECTLKKQYIHMIQNGKKTVEGRINSGMFKGYKKGDLVRFFYQQNPQDDVTCKIEDAVPYKSFEEMLRAEGVGCCIPGIYNVSEGVRAYHQIPGYEQKAKQHGVVAFRLKVVRSGSSHGRC